MEATKKENEKILMGLRNLLFSAEEKRFKLIYEIEEHLDLINGKEEKQALSKPDLESSANSWIEDIRERIINADKANEMLLNICNRLNNLI